MGRNLGKARKKKMTANGSAVRYSLDKQLLLLVVVVVVVMVVVCA